MSPTTLRLAIGAARVCPKDGGAGPEGPVYDRPQRPLRRAPEPSLRLQNRINRGVGPHQVWGLCEPPLGDVSFSRSNKTVGWDDSIHSLLDLAESAGLQPDFSCRSGICSSCACRLIDGEVEYFEEPLELPDEGEVLICCARPKGPVVLEL